MIFNKHILIVLILFLLVSIQNAAIIKDITPAGSSTYNLENIQYTLSGTCEFKKMISCIDDAESTCSQAIVTTSSNMGPTLLKSNSTAAVYFLYSSTIPTGQITLVTIDAKIIYSLECIEIDPNQISFKLINKYYKVLDSETFGYNFYGLFKMEGLLTDQLFKIRSSSISFDFTPLICDFEYQYSNYFLLRFKDQIISNVTSPIKFQISGFSKSFYLDPIVNDSFIVGITDFSSSVESDFDLLVLPGLNLGPVFSVTTNTLAYDSLIYFEIEQSSAGFSTFSKMYYPIYGNLSSTTFLFPFFEYGIEMNYKLYSQNKDKFLLNNVLNAITIPQYLLQTPQISDINSLIYPTSDSFYVINFGNSVKYSFTKMNLKVSSYPTFSRSFPFGFFSGSSESYVFRVSVPVLQYDQGIVFVGNQISFLSEVDGSGPNFSYNNFITGNSNGPVVKKIETINIVSDLYLFRITADIPNLFFYISIDLEQRKFGPESLIDGDLESGVFEFVARAKYDKISIFDQLGNSQVITDSTLININPILVYKSPFLSGIDYYSISNVSFLYSVLDVTSYRQFNILYFNYSSEIPRDSVFILSPSYDSFQDITNPKYYYSSNIFYSTYNESSQLFQIEFYVEANSPSGNFNFDLVYGLDYINSKSLSKQLIIKSSNMDLRGPIFAQMNSSIPSITPTGSTGILIIDILIEDPINGFKSGYITFRADQDQSIYNFTITLNDLLPGGNMYLGIYQFRININYPCISQNIIIAEAKLLDQLDRVSFFSIYNKASEYSSVMNPFIKFLGTLAFNEFSINCFDPIIDDSPPNLISITATPSSIDVLKANRKVVIEFTAQDPESGIKIGQQNPIVYLSTVNNRIIECNSTIVESVPLSTGNSVSYFCEVQLPIGFGYPQGIYISIYGFINNYGYWSGFTSNELFANAKTFYIQTTISYNEPNIESYFRITEYESELWLFGNNLFSVISATITYNESSVITNSPIKTYTSAALIEVFKTDKPYKVALTTSGGIQSNTFTIIPTIFNYYNQSSIASSSSESSSLSPSSSSSSSDTPLPTNAPKSCPGKPVCGGPSNGKCITNQGCVCYSPWIGLDCSSQIIVIDPPKTNETSPSTNITLPTKDNNNNSTVTYKSLITLVSIREIDILGNIAYNKTFDIWQVRQLQSDNTTFIYNTTLQINKNNQITLTNVTVTLEWFINETTINFANEELTMNPSTMKYTIEINNYPFNSDLNQLQLIMSASIQSDTNENICSVREFGETTTGDNSNYLKIQVDNHSLYGRFIRRGIIDSKIAAVSNILLDKDMNSITTNKQLQSFIGIQIPHFKNNIILDPDFSILIDSNKASSKSNSICSNKSKLTGAKIAGIVIGCAAFVAVIIIAISYHIIKKKKDAKFISNVNQKMKSMNNDKL